MSLAFDQTDNYLASCSLDKTVKLFSIQQCVEKHKSSQQNKGIVQTIANAILTPSISPFCTTTSVGSPLNSICWSVSTKNILYTADDSGSLRTYKLNVGKNIQDSMIYEVDSKQGPQNGSNYVFCASEGITLGGNDGKMRIYDENNRKELFKFDIIEEINKNNKHNQFQVNTTRAWCISQDKKNHIYAVGFDEGYMVYKISCNTVCQSKQFYIRDGRLNQITQQKDKYEQNEIFDCKQILEQYTKINQLCEPIDLVCLGDPFPMLLGYNTSNNNIRYFIFLNSKRDQKISEIISQCPISQKLNESIVSTLINNKIIIYNINFGGLQTLNNFTYDQSIKINNLLFCQDNYIIQSQNKTFLIDKNQQILSELPIYQQIQKILYCCGFIIFQSFNKIYVFNQQFQLIDIVSSCTPISSCIVSQFANNKDNIILYSNNTHICYYHVSTKTHGCLTSINQQIFLYQNKDNIISFFTNETILLTITFDNTISNLIIKAGEHKVGDVYQLQRKLKKQKFTPISVCKRLIDVQEPNAALQMLSDKNFTNIKNYIQIKQHMPVEYKEGLDKKQVQINSILSLQLKELLKSSNCMEQATLNALLQSNEQVNYNQQDFNEQLIASMINHDNQQLMKLLIDAKMYGAAKALCENYNLDQNELDQQIPQKIQKQLKVQKGKQLQFKNRSNKIDNWIFKYDDQVTEDITESQQEQVQQVEIQQQIVTKQWKDDESSSESQSQHEEVKQEKQKQSTGFDESSSSESSEKSNIFDINSQQMKQLGIHKDSKFAQEMLLPLQDQTTVEFTLSDIKNQIQKGLQLFTDAEFVQSKQQFQEALFNSKLLLALGQVTQKQIKQLQDKCVIYLRALTCEIYRREHEDASQEQQANLILGFASCTQNNLFENDHKQLVLKLMMHKMKKLDYRSAQIIAQELIKVTTDQEILQKAEKVLQKVGKEKIESLPQFQSLKDIQVDFSNMKDVTQNMIANLSSCSYCESLYSKQQQCIVCQCGSSD